MIILTWLNNEWITSQLEPPCSVAQIIDLAAFWSILERFLGRYSTSLPRRRPVETLIQRDSGRIHMEDLCSSLSDMLTGHSAVGRAPNSHSVALPWQHRLGVGINCRFKPQPMKHHHSRASLNQQGVILTLSVSGYTRFSASVKFSLHS